jgi:hypothetical protein
MEDKKLKIRRSKIKIGKIKIRMRMNLSCVLPRSRAPLDREPRAPQARSRLE